MNDLLSTVHKYRQTTLNASGCTCRASGLVQIPFARGIEVAVFTPFEGVSSDHQLPIAASAPWTVPGNVRPKRPVF